MQDTSQTVLGTTVLFVAGTASININEYLKGHLNNAPALALFISIVLGVALAKFIEYILLFLPTKFSWLRRLMNKDAVT
ncbi:MAG: hypothetical protein F6K30_28970 [Cyanothece sp. SIO2G6]|nr:hypothetical protein [Cyanothece sp. SIO2G6]